MCGSSVVRCWLAAWIVGAWILAAPVALQAAPVPVLEYRFDDAVSSLVPNHGSLGAAGDGTLTGSATVGSGGTPFFPDKSGYLTIGSTTGARMATPDVDSLDLATDLTLSYWVKPTVASGSWREMFGDCTNSTSDHGSWYSQAMDLGTRNRAIVLVGYENPSGNYYHFNYSDDNLIMPNEWQQVTIVLKGVGLSGPHTWTAEFYRNGRFHSSFTSPSTNYPMKDRPDGFKIGDTHWDQSLLAQYGRVAMFDVALTPAEVRAYYDGAFPEPSSLALLGLGAVGLVVYLRRGRPGGDRRRETP